MENELIDVEEIKEDSEENKDDNKETNEGLQNNKDVNKELEKDTQEFTIKEFNTISTIQGDINFNEQMYIELKTTNLYLNLILIAVVVCFLYFMISKALKKLFYINI